MALSVAVRQFHTPKARLRRRLVKVGQGTKGLSLFNVAHVPDGEEVWE